MTAISPAGAFASHVPYAIWVMMDLVEAATRTERHVASSASRPGPRCPQLALSPGCNACLTSRGSPAEENGAEQRSGAPVATSATRPPRVQPGDYARELSLRQLHTVTGVGVAIQIRGMPAVHLTCTRLNRLPGSGPGFGGEAAVRQCQGAAPSIL